MKGLLRDQIQFLHRYLNIRFYSASRGYVNCLRVKRNRKESSAQYSKWIKLTIKALKQAYDNNNPVSSLKNESSFVVSKSVMR